MEFKFESYDNFLSEYKKYYFHSCDKCGALREADKERKFALRQEKKKQNTKGGSIPRLKVKRTGTEIGDITYGNLLYFN